MGMIYITSDTHFSHDKNFLWEPRGFKNQWEMNENIIKNWNSVVTEEDDVYLLGDVILCDNVEGIKCLKQLRGKIHIIRGNHDTDARIELYKACPNVVEVCDAKWLKANKHMFFLSHYPCLSDNYDDDKPLSRKVINLCGHRHTPDKWFDWDKGLIYHVEMDAHGCKPISIDKILTDIKQQLDNNH